ncbi:hypothetical protein M3Y97_00615800 [Aphelenchoides bicaudatus]|nr:hypothetical protein M3Y97_00615800 [Aphelenchoides bicaudatus]
MLNNTTEKLAHIQNKIETINERLEAGRLYSISSCGSDSISLCSASPSPTLYTLQSFMDACTIFEDYTFKLHTRYAHSTQPTMTLSPPLNLLEQLSTTTASSTHHHLKDEEIETLNEVQLQDLKKMSDQMDLLADYRRNNWMCVAAMCVALCTSSFFLFILPITEVCKKRELVMGVLDLISFSAIPLLLTTRIFIVEALHQSLAPAILGAHKLLPAERAMNFLQCTVYQRERLPFCSDVVLSTIFPVILLKYLIILALLTLLYIGVAYLIEWCIRHFFPHKHPSDRKCRRSLRHSCCACTPAPKSGYDRCPSMASIRPLRPYQNRSYIPQLSSIDGNLKPALKQNGLISQQTISSHPLLADKDQQVHEDQHSVAESIPAEPLPSQKV